MKMVGVDCSFDADGKVQVKKVWFDGRWQPVEQGRQWTDEVGRHLLVMLPGDHVQQLTLLSGALRWELAEIRKGGKTAV